MSCRANLTSKKGQTFRLLSSEHWIQLVAGLLLKSMAKLPLVSLGTDLNSVFGGGTQQISNRSRSTVNSV